MNNTQTGPEIKPMNDGVHEHDGADVWRRPLNGEDREFLRCTKIHIEPEMEEYCSAAVPLQWFGEAEFKKLESAVAVARLLAERELKQEDEQGRAESVPLSPAELTARRGEVLRLYAHHHYVPLLALILHRTASCSTTPQPAWNSPLAAGRWFGSLLDLVRPAGRLACDALDPLLICLAAAVEMAPLPLREDDEHRELPCFRNAILLWAKYAELMLRALTSRGLRLNGATVRKCNTVKQAVGCLRLGAHPSSVVAALSNSDQDVADFLGVFARACVAFHVSPDHAYEQGSDAAADFTMPESASRHDDLLEPLPVAEDPLPGAALANGDGGATEPAGPGKPARTVGAAVGGGPDAKPGNGVSRRHE